MSKVPAKGKSRLGRGLSSLIPVMEDVSPTEAGAERGNASDGVAPSGGTAAAFEGQSPPPSSGQPLEVEVAGVSLNPHQPRKVFNEASLAELAASVRANGVIQPIVVRKTAGGYQLVAGERRLRAAKLAGLATVPAIVREVDAFTQAQMALVENIQREDLNPIDRAQGYRVLLEQLGLTQAELAGRLGEDRSSIANFLRLLELAEPVRAMVRDGRLSVGHAKLLAGISDILEQERLAHLVVSQGLSVRNLERLIQQGGVTPPPPREAPSAHLAELEKQIGRQLGMRVQVKAGSKKGRGRIVIHYGSLDQFDDLLQRLRVEVEKE